MAILVSAASAAGQVGTPEPAYVFGQVFAPDGGVMQQVLRFVLRSDDATRPPEYLFTDSNGRFVITRLFQGVSYTITVEGDGQNWDTTSVSFIPVGRRYGLQIYLRRLVHEVADSPSVSVGQMQQQVPRAARKEYEAALKLLRRGDRDRARPRLERAIALYPDYVDARNELSVALLKAGRLAAAEEQLRRALQSDPVAVRPLLNLGLCLFRQQRYAEAVPFLDKAMQLEPGNPSGQLLLGVSLVMLGDDARAVPALVRAYDLGGKRAAQAQFYLAQTYMRQKDYVRAAAALETYLRDVPDDPNAEQLRATLARLRSPTPDL